MVTVMIFMFHDSVVFSHTVFFFVCMIVCVLLGIVIGNSLWVLVGGVFNSELGVA